MRFNFKQFKAVCLSRYPANTVQWILRVRIKYDEFNVEIIIMLMIQVIIISIMAVHKNQKDKKN